MTHVIKKQFLIFEEMLKRYSHSWNSFGLRFSGSKRLIRQTEITVYTRTEYTRY